MSEANSAADLSGATGLSASKAPDTRKADAALTAPAPAISLGAPTPRKLWELSCPVFVVGFMGAGKTTNSRKLARQCGLSTVDLDAFIERREGKAIKEIFAELGEDAFRDIETQALHEFAAETNNPLIVSCGGGIILRSENREILKSKGYVIFLNTTADQAAAHIHDLSTRPLFQNLEAARKRAEDREPLYREVADVTIETAGKTVNMITSEMKRALQKARVLRPRN